MSDDVSGTVPQLRALRGVLVEVDMLDQRRFMGTLLHVALDVMGRPQYLELRTSASDRQMILPWCNVIVLTPAAP